MLPIRMKNIITHKCKNSHKPTIPAEPRSDYKDDLQSEFANGSYGVQISDDIWTTKLSILIVFASWLPTISLQGITSSLPSKHTCELIFSKGFCECRHLHYYDATRGCHALSFAVLPSNCIADLSFSWCIIHGTTMEHSVLFRDLLHTLSWQQHCR